MKDKCVLVTGSSSGIGYEITLKLLGLGAKVIGIARNHDRSKLENKNYTTYKCDVSAHQKLEILLKQILKNHPQINCFISNAGYGDFGPLENFSTLQIKNFIATNLTSHMVITKLLLPHFKRIKIGDIIFIGSEAGLLGAKNGSLYCTAKFGLRGFSEALSKDVANKNIRVNCISPGGILDQQPESFLKRYRESCTNFGMLSPQQVAQPIAFLLSSCSSAINGQNIVVDDGWSL